MDPERFDADHTPTAELLDDLGARLTLRVRVRGPLPLAAYVRTEPDNEERLTPLQEVGRAAGGWRVLAAEIDVASHEPLTRYAFRFLFADHQVWLSAAGLHPGEPEGSLHFRHAAGYQGADWVRGAVFYQIFPDRFAIGSGGRIDLVDDRRVDGVPVIHRDWTASPTRGMGAREHFGGDLFGVRERLGYLDDLGVNALYLNPIFESPSSHRYDTVDYERVDPFLGGDAAFLALRAETEARRMRIVLDAVVNHTSDQHPWFDRAGGAAEPGAYQSAASPHRERFVFRDPDDPESYVGWAGVRSLPVLDFSSPQVRDDTYLGPNAILRRWLRAPWSIDGWRLDVIHMLGEGAGARENARHVRGIRRAIRAERSDAYVLGEHFFDAVAWLQGDMEDGAMNYAGFLRPMLAFWAGIDFRGAPERLDGAGLEERFTRVRARLPWPIATTQFNLLSSHDVPRFLSRVGGDVQALIAAYHTLFGYVGTPCIYYGDEIGLEGGEDPDNRRPFPWDPLSWRSDVRDAVRALAHLRRRHRALAVGRYRSLIAAGDVHAFGRVDGLEAVVVVVHRSGGTVNVPVWRLGGQLRWRDALSGEVLRAEGGVLRVAVAPRGGRTLEAIDEVGRG
jgi:alpha-glucosidase